MVERESRQRLQQPRLPKRQGYGRRDFVCVWNSLGRRKILLPVHKTSQNSMDLHFRIRTQNRFLPPNQKSRARTYSTKDVKSQGEWTLMLQNDNIHLVAELHKDSLKVDGWLLACWMNSNWWVWWCRWANRWCSMKMGLENQKTVEIRSQPRRVPAETAEEAACLPDRQAKSAEFFTYISL